MDPFFLRFSTLQAMWSALWCFLWGWISGSDTQLMLFLCKLKQADYY